MTDQLAAIIDAAWDARDGVSTATTGEVRDAVEVLCDLPVFALDGVEIRRIDQHEGRQRRVFVGEKLDAHRTRLGLARGLGFLRVGREKLCRLEGGTR